MKIAHWQMPDGRPLTYKGSGICHKPPAMQLELTKMAQAGMYEQLFRALDKLASPMHASEDDEGPAGGGDVAPQSETPGPQKRCDKCFAAVKLDDSFCSKCGCPQKRGAHIRAREKERGREYGKHSDDVLTSGETGGKAAVNEELAHGAYGDAGKYAAAAKPDLGTYGKLPAEYQNLIAGPAAVAGGYGVVKMRRATAPTRKAMKEQQRAAALESMKKKLASVSKARILNIRKPRKLTTAYKPKKAQTPSEALKRLRQRGSTSRRGLAPARG